MAAEPTPPYTNEQLNEDSVTKKDLVTFLQENGTGDFLRERKLKGQLKNVTKTKTKDSLIQDYKDLFEKKAFRQEGEDAAEAAVKAAIEKQKAEEITEKTGKLEIKDEGPPKFQKRIIKKGNKINFPSKGAQVSCFYIGKLQDGTVFDTNVQTGRNARKAQPLKFKVGVGRVIRGWDEALMQMSLGEKSEITIEPEWAYGRRGVEGKVPPNSTLIFEVELTAVE